MFRFFRNKNMSLGSIFSFRILCKYLVFFFFSIWVVQFWQLSFLNLSYRQYELNSVVSKWVKLVHSSFLSKKQKNKYNSKSNATSDFSEALPSYCLEVSLQWLIFLCVCVSRFCLKLWSFIKWCPHWGDRGGAFLGGKSFHPILKRFSCSDCLPHWAPWRKKTYWSICNPLSPVKWHLGLEGKHFSLFRQLLDLIKQISS